MTNAYDHVYWQEASLNQEIAAMLAHIDDLTDTNAMLITTLKRVLDALSVPVGSRAMGFDLTLRHNIKAVIAKAEGKS